MKRKNRISRWRIGLSIAGTLLVVAAIQDQLRRPPEERTWYGNVFGIPYDFRLPTVERVKEKVWNKDDEHIVTPHIFGVGWSINFYPLLHRKAA